MTDHLSSANIDFARHVAYRLGHGYEVDEFVSDAYEGLIKAAHDFDPARGVAFQTWAYHKIRGEMQAGVNWRRHWFTLAGSHTGGWRRIGAAARVPLEDGSYLPDVEDMVDMLTLYNSLSSREQGVLRMTLYGYTVTEIAKKCRMDRNNVCAIRKKFHSTIVED